MTLSGLPPGGIVVRQVNPPALHSAAPDLVFTIAADEHKEFTIVDPRWAKVTITVQTQSVLPVPGGCFWAFADAGGGTKGELIAPTQCDNADGHDDGSLVMGIPAGDVVLEERITPNGYIAPDPLILHLDIGEERSTTFVDKTPTTLIVRTVDVWGDLVDRTDLHLVQTAGGSADIEESTNGGTLKLPFIAPGTYAITATTQYTQPGYFPPVDPVVVTIADLESKTVDIVLRQAPPKITVGVYIGDVSASSVLLYWVTDQKTIGEVDYGRSASLGSVALATPQIPIKTHRMRINSLRSGTTYYFVAVGHNANGDVQSTKFTITTATSSQTASIVVTKVRASDGAVLKAACWEVYANQSGALGAYAGSACDLTDDAGNDGVSTIRGLAAGTYWLVESLAPKGYLHANNVKVTLTAGQTRTLTVQDKKGGATLHILSMLDHTKLQPGTCFAVFINLGVAGDGAYVGSNCDDFDGQADAYTLFYGLAPGGYNIYEYDAPGNVVPSQLATAYIQTFDKDAYATFDNFSPSYKGNVIAVTQNAAGEPLIGACFWIYYNAGGGVPSEFYRSACDSSDGTNDGRTTFLEVNPASYVIVEVVAPPGYQTGAKTSFTKTDKRRTLTFTQTAGGQVVKVTTVKGGGTTALKGACYGLYRFSSNGTLLQPITLACDADDGALDEVTRIVSVPDGTYRLYQITTPKGYKRPAYVSVTVSGKNRSITVHTNHS